ncbi:cation diffusion facilitator family transporter [soil metagenome]
MQEGSRKAIVAAFFANLGIAIAKFVGFFLTSSAGLLAEAGHSLADTSNQALLLLGGRRASRVADEDHPFCYGRERYFLAFVVALVLFSMGGLFALYEGIQKLIDPHETENLAVAIGILIVAIGLETFSLRTAVREANHVKPTDMGWWEFIRTSKQPELPVVLLEDVGAEIGLFLALAGVSLAATTGDPRWDAVGSIAIGVLLIVIGIFLAIETRGLLLGERAAATSEEAIRRAITSHPAVRNLIHLRTQHLGPDVLLVGAKIEFANEFDTPRLATEVNAVETAIRAVEPMAKWIYLEPDLLRSAGGGT